MKTGTILYITGNEPVNSNLNKNKVFKHLGIISDHMEFISDKSGHMDMHDAWFSLVSKGVHHVNCRLASFNINGDLELSAREMRLMG